MPTTPPDPEPPAAAEPEPMAEARAAYMQDLLQASLLLIGAVRDATPQASRDAIAKALALPAPPDVDRHEALYIVLAAQAHYDAPPSKILGWIEGRARAGALPALTETQAEGWRKLDRRMAEVLDRLAPAADPELEQIGDPQLLDHMRDVLEGRTPFREASRVVRILVARLLTERRQLPLAVAARQVRTSETVLRAAIADADQIRARAASPNGAAA